MRTTCAPIVLGVCGWALAPRTAHPRVGSALGSFTWGQCSAVSGCAAHYHTLEQPQACAAPVCLLGVGLPPHATAKHDSTTAPPRLADASRSAPIAGGKVELELMCAEG